MVDRLRYNEILVSIACCLNVDIQCEYSMPSYDRIGMNILYDIRPLVTT